VIVCTCYSVTVGNVCSDRIRQIYQNTEKLVPKPSGLRNGNKSQLNRVVEAQSPTIVVLEIKTLRRMTWS